MCARVAAETLGDILAFENDAMKSVPNEIQAGSSTG